MSLCDQKADEQEEWEKSVLVPLSSNEESSTVAEGDMSSGFGFLSFMVCQALEVASGLERQKDKSGVLQ